EVENEIYEDIKELIDTRILPTIQEDGGDMEFRGFDFENGVVFVKLKGACTTCSLSENTLKNGIEKMLSHYVEEVKSVKQVFDPNEEIALNEFAKFEEKLRKSKS
ncbi:NifU family protein, partial [Ascoidea rubescens DSM 1968]